MNLRHYLLATPKQIRLVKILVHCVCLGYLVVMLWLGGYDLLGADPVKALRDFTGLGAINLLFITLCMSPVAVYFHWGAILKLRRMVGIYSFVYAVAHLLVYLLFDLQLAWSLFFDEIVRRPYIIVGMGGLIILLLLTLTSPKIIQRKMGIHWKRLHRLVYIALPLALLHYSWAQKTLWSEALWYWGAAVILFVIKQKSASKTRSSRPSVR